MNRGERRISKVLVAGPVGVGKSTAVQSASDVPVLSTEARPSDETRLRKEATTVAMDFGMIRLDEGHEVHLYGTPGQRRFDFMWDILVEGSVGVIVLVDAGARPIEDDLDAYLGAFARMPGERRLVLGVTRGAAASVSALEPYRDYLDRKALRVPVLEADPRSRSDVMVLVRAVLATVQESRAADEEAAAERTDGG